MRAHAKPVGNGLEVFCLLMNAVAATPPPGLMNERSVRGVHEANDAVVDADGHVGGEVGELVLAAGRFPELLSEFFDLRRGNWSGGGLSESRALRTGLRNVNPDETVLLLTGITAGVDAIDS